MSEAPDIATAWHWLLERRPGTRGATHDALPVVVEAAYAEPSLRALYPFPTHGTLHFLRSAPPWPDSDHDEAPFILYGGPPYQVYSSRYTDLLGECATPAEAAALVVSHLPAHAGGEPGV
ncbi:DUF6193 family natural product biosynthesis protein [Streptomyces sp. CA-210063]|uniref:DUF6193 family natural product biosynthesis protein n=1 Tax=Streptomyces sp. CA-210063 TaxID=2801029 RepID=UPI00214B1FEC|nr:DUF6193 family natural product biosynthesis protein [Streptomyces sp. CA-210063]UUU36382.1 DUF6193 family natural product biosynthesis protein [Streptomyces sp. CA-210063]